MTCPHCARHISPDWRGRLCPYCGATLYALTDAARTSVQQIDAANQRNELRDRAHAAEGMIGALGRDLEAAHVQIAELTADRDSWREERQRFAGRVARAHAALNGDPVLSED